MRSYMRRAFLLGSAAVMVFDPLRSLAQVAPSSGALPPVPSADGSTQPADTQPINAAKFNFENAPINTVLNYVSTQFGYVVIPEVPVTGRITVLSRQPVSSDEALVMLNTALRVNGYAAIQQGRILKITTVDSAKKEGIPVHFGTNPADIDDSDELITQVMPIKSMDAVKLKTDLAPLIDSSADVSSNGSSNSIIITDTSSRIKRLAKIIYNMDTREAADNDIIVRQLKFADASAAAKLILDIFKPADQQQQNQQPQNGFAALFGRGGGGFGRGGGGGGFGGFGGGGAAGGGAAAAQGSTAGQVGTIEASSDDRTNTVVVTGPKDTLALIRTVLDQLDQNPAEEETFFPYLVKNGQATDMAATLNALFSGSGSTGTTNRSTNGVNSATGNRIAGGFGNGGGLGGGGGGAGGGGRGGGGGGGGLGGGGLGGGGGGRAGGGGLGGGGGGFGGGGGGFGGGGGRGGAAVTSASANATGVAALIGQVLVVADSDTNTLLIATASKYKQQVLDVIAQLDRPVPQVLIRALIAEVTHDNGDQVGVDFSVLNLRSTTSGSNSTTTEAANGSTVTSSGQNGVPYPTNLQTGYPLTTTFVQTNVGQTIGTNLGTAAAAAATPSGLVLAMLESNVQATIMALETEGKLDVLSRPYILTSDNQEATVFVGEEDPYVSDTRVETTGQLVNTIEYEQIGVELDVTPHVNPDGLVTMQVNPQVSQKQPGGTTITAGVVSPIFSQRTATCQVAIKDGETIVIGGMMQDQTSQNVNKIPFLGDLPLIGPLFQNNQTAKQKTELLFFLTPHVSMEPAHLTTLTNAEMKGLQLTPNAVQPGVFQQHLRGLQSGGTPAQDNTLYIPPPTTQGSKALGEPDLPTTSQKP